MNSQFIVLVERWLVIPLIGYLITINWFRPEDKSWLIPLIDNVFGSAFIILAYIMTHKTPVVDNSKNLSFWEKCKSFLFKNPTPPTPPAVPPTDTPKTP